MLYDLLELRPVTPLTKDLKSPGLSFSRLDLPGTSSNKS